MRTSLLGKRGRPSPLGECGEADSRMQCGPGPLLENRARTNSDYQPLTAPEVMPRMKYRCNDRKTRIGMTIVTKPAEGMSSRP